MSRRPKMRIVRVRLTSRNANDSFGLLKSIEEVFHPKVLEIVQDPGKPDIPSAGSRAAVVDEELETVVSSSVSHALDQAAAAHFEAPESVGVHPPAIASARIRLVAWISGLVAKGYAVTVKAVTEAVLKHYDPHR